MKSGQDRICITTKENKLDCFYTFLELSVIFKNQTNLQSIMILELISVTLLISIFSQTSFGDDDVHNSCTKNKDCAKGMGCLLVKRWSTTAQLYYTAGLAQKSNCTFIFFFNRSTFLENVQLCVLRTMNAIREKCALLT